MKAFFNLHHGDAGWAEKLFPEIHPWLLPVVNKPLIEYLLDYCSITGIVEVLIVDGEYSSVLAEFLGGGERWNLQVTYTGGRTETDCGVALSRHSHWIGGDELLVFNGFFFLHYDGSSPYQPDCEGDESDRTEFMSLRDATGRFRCLDWRVSALRGVEAYYNLNICVFETERHGYVLPGYNVENGVYTGINDVIPPGVCFEPPVSLGNDVNLADGCVIGPSAIIGDNVIVDDRTVIRRSIIMSATYLGSDLELDGKIVCRGLLIDPESGTSLNLLDRKLAGGVIETRRRHPISRLFGTLVALVLVVIQTPLYFWFRINGLIPHRKVRRIRSRRTGELFLHEMVVFEPSMWHWRDRLFRRLLLDKYPEFVEVSMRRLRMVGDYPYDEKTAFQFVRDNYVDYSPGVFFNSSDPDAKKEDIEHLIDDLYYRHKLSVFLNWRVLLTRIFERLLEVHDG